MLSHDPNTVESTLELIGFPAFPTETGHSLDSSQVRYNLNSLAICAIGWPAVLPVLSSTIILVLGPPQTAAKSSSGNG